VGDRLLSGETSHIEVQEPLGNYVKTPCTTETVFRTCWRIKKIWSRTDTYRYKKAIRGQVLKFWGKPCETTKTDIKEAAGLGDKRIDWGGVWFEGAKGYLPAGRRDH